jgi:hypothetical protein
MAFSGNATRAVSEDEFAGLVNSLAADPVGSAQLTDLLHEEHPVYAGRGTATSYACEAGFCSRWRAPGSPIKR